MQIFPGSWFHFGGVFFLLGTADADYRPAAKWKALGGVIEQVVVWDSVYYVRIAECGYEYEQTHAFFPALPLLMQFVANTGECQSQ